MENVKTKNRIICGAVLLVMCAIIACTSIFLPTSNAKYVVTSTSSTTINVSGVTESEVDMVYSVNWMVQQISTFGTCTNNDYITYNPSANYLYVYFITKNSTSAMDNTGYNYGRHVAQHIAEDANSGTTNTDFAFTIENKKNYANKKIIIFFTKQDISNMDATVVLHEVYKFEFPYVESTDTNGKKIYVFEEVEEYYVSSCGLSAKEMTTADNKKVIISYLNIGSYDTENQETISLTPESIG